MYHITLLKMSGKMSYVKCLNILFCWDIRRHVCNEEGRTCIVLKECYGSMGEEFIVTQLLSCWRRAGLPIAAQSFI